MSMLLLRAAGKAHERINRSPRHEHIIILFILDKVEAVSRIIFCACDGGDGQISEQEISAASCIDVQKYVFHDNYITIDGFKQLAVNDNSFIKKEEVDTALNNLIEENRNYLEFFRGQSNGKD